MISQFLPMQSADAVALDFGVFVAEQARTHHVSQTAIIAALRPCITPSQPEGSSSPHAPAAQTDGDVTPPASPSTPIPEAPKPLPDAPDNPADALSQPAEAKTSEPASGEDLSPDGGAFSAVKGANARLESAEGAEPPPSPNQSEAGSHLSEAHRYAFERVRAEFEADPTRPNKEIARAAKCNLARANSWLRQLRNERVEAMKSGLVAAAPKPAQPTAESPAEVGPDGRRVTIKSRVWAVHYEHPDWTAQQVADHLGAKKGSVATALFDARQARNAELAIAEPAPVPNPQKPVAPPPPAGFTLKYRVRVIHQQHPTLTAGLIAKQLGANPTSVSTYLAQIRNETDGSPEAEAEPPPRMLPNGHAGEVETRIRSEAAARAARLGKPS